MRSQQNEPPLYVKNEKDGSIRELKRAQKRDVYTNIRRYKALQELEINITLF